MMRPLGLLLVLAATAPAQVHTRSALVQGQPATFALSAAPAGGTAWFAFGFGGLGNGACIPPAGPCLGVIGPLWLAPGLPIDASGNTQLGLILPTGAPLVPVASQALVAAAASTMLQVSNSLGGTVETLASLSDEFEGTTLDPRWQILNGASFSRQVSGGDLVMTVLQGGPALTWFDDGEGPFVYQMVRGDFDATAAVHTYRRSNPTLPPPLSFNLGGLCVRDPDAPPGDHDWVHLTVGAGNAGTPVAVEDKNTIDSRSNLQLYPVPTPHVELRMTRQGSRISCFWRPVGGTAWTALRTFDRPDLPPLVQLGFNSMFWPTSPPDIEQRIAWFRIR